MIGIRKVPTDRGIELTDCLFGLRKGAATGGHESDRQCSELGIQHRLTLPKSPKINGIFERFNRKIEEVLQSHHYRSGSDLVTAPHRYFLLYNQQLPPSALANRSFLRTMKDWFDVKPAPLKKWPCNLRRFHM